MSSSGHGWPSGPVATGLAVGVDGRELGALRQQPELDLARQDPRADRLVALVEDALVPVGPLRGDEVGGVAGLRREVHEERLVGVDDLGVRMNSTALSARSSARW